MNLLELDYEALKAQKDILIRMIQSWGEADDPEQRAEAKEAEGLVSMIDAMQDHAVDKLGLEEEYVFNIEKTYKVLYIEENEIHDWTIDDILNQINRDRSGKWTDYNKSDWREGWNEWVKEEGYYKLIED